MPKSIARSLSVNINGCINEIFPLKEQHKQIEQKRSHLDGWLIENYGFILKCGFAGHSLLREGLISGKVSA